jgi:hypothetical protein
MHRADLAVLEADGANLALPRPAFTAQRPMRSSRCVTISERRFRRPGHAAARRALASSVHYHVEANKVMAACRERRDRENRHFAETLAGGYEAACTAMGSPRCTACGSGPSRRFGSLSPNARLFLVVLDGCSYPVFLELLHALSQDNSFPLGVRPDSDGRVAGLPALSPLPTVTSHAARCHLPGRAAERSAGRRDCLPRPGRGEDRQGALQSERRAREPHPPAVPQGDLADGGQESASGARRRASVRRGHGLQRSGRPDRILEHGRDSTAGARGHHGVQARAAGGVEGWARVLVTADHGHSPYVDKSLRWARQDARVTCRSASTMRSPRASSRSIWQGWVVRPSDAPSHGGRATYLGGPQVGFHGGCGLEEMVVPLAWIERDGLHADEPSWWYGRGALAEASVALRPVAPPIVTPLPSDELQPVQAKPQLSLFNPADKASALPLPPRCWRGSASTRSPFSCCCARTGRHARASWRSA